MQIRLKILYVILSIFAINSKSFEGIVRIVDKYTDSKLADEICNLMYTKHKLE
jgi:hypothetical protein